MPRTVRYNRKLEELILADGQDRQLYHFGFTFHVDDLKGVKPGDLTTALRSAADRADPAVSVTSDEYLDEEYSLVEPVSFELVEDRLQVCVAHTVQDYIEEDEDARELFSRVLAAYLAQNKTNFVGAERDESCAAAPYVWTIGLTCSPRGRDMADLYRIGVGAAALLKAFETGELTRETTLHLIRAGQARALIGQPEGPWLDVKSQNYNLASPADKIELAQDIARFANAEHGGIIVVGMRGKKIPGGEVIHSLCPVPTLDGGQLRKHQQAIENHLYPPPDLLDIEAVAVDDGSLLIIHVPPQSEELKPFLVHGAVINGKVEGAFISIVRRRGETSIPTTAPALHATLAAGRALLRRGELPGD